MFAVARGPAGVASVPCCGFAGVVSRAGASAAAFAAVTAFDDPRAPELK
jgi:hypothetical protein